MPLVTPTPGPTPTIPGPPRPPRPLARAMEAYADRLDVDKIREAYDFAVEAHAGQRPALREEYVSHTVEVATILAKLRLDSASIISGLMEPRPPGPIRTWARPCPTGSFGSHGSLWRA